MNHEILDKKLVELRTKYTSDWWINLHASDGCNLKCSYCYYSNKQKTLPQYPLKHLVEFAARTDKTVGICFYGGEPCLNVPFMEEVVAACSQIDNEVYYSIQTNGTLLHQLPLDLLQEFYMLAISVDGRRETTDAGRGAGVFDKIIENVGKVREQYEYPIMARMTISHHSDVALDILELTKHFEYIYWQIDNDLCKKPTELFVKDYMTKIEQVFFHWLELLKKEQHVILIPFYGVYILFKTSVRSKSHYYHCAPGRNSATINCEGVIFGCPEGVARSCAENDHKSRIGDITDLKHFYVEPYDLKPACTTCDVHHICGGRCIWSYDPLYCDCTKKIIQLVHDNMQTIEDYFPEESLIDDLEVLYSTEIIP